MVKPKLLHGLLLSLLVAPVSHGTAATMSLTLAWDPPTVTVGGLALTNCVGYKLYRGPAIGIYDHVQAVGLVTQVVVHGLDDSQAYCFAVTACDAGGRESGYSDEFRWRARLPTIASPLALSTNLLHLTAIAGVGGPPQSIAMWSTGGSVPFRILEQPAWVYCDPPAGVIANTAPAPAVTISAGRLAPGRYTSTLKLETPGQADANAIHEVLVVLDVFPVFSLAPDSDGDGLDDISELLVGTQLSRKDSDGDGLGDRDELLCGTDPLDSAAVLTIQDVSVDGAGRAFAWRSSPGVTYAVEVSEDLVCWRLAPQGVATDEQNVRLAAAWGTLAYRDTTVASRRAYYRLRVSPP